MNKQQVIVALAEKNLPVFGVEHKGERATINVTDRLKIEITREGLCAAARLVAVNEWMYSPWTYSKDVLMSHYDVMAMADAEHIIEEAKRNKRKPKKMELRQAFYRVQPANDWRDPINKVLPSLNDDEQELLTQAIVAITGSVPTFKRLPSGSVRVTADGVNRRLAHA